MSSSEEDKEEVVLTRRCITRIQRDTADLVKDPPYGILALPDEEDMQKVNVMIVGPKDTPYQGGLFYFLVNFTPYYPFKPPSVKLLTTGDETVRFGPNLYEDGHICLSILGTFSGPSWAATSNLSAVCVSIQSLMNEKPYLNEPGNKKSTDDIMINKVNKIVQHETIRIAACDVYENRKSYPEHFHAIIEETFRENYDYYIDTCKSNMDQDGKSLKDELVGSKEYFCFKRLLEKLESYNVK